MTQQQVLAFLKISKVTILEYRRKGYLTEKIKNGGRLFYDKKEILNFALNPPNESCNRFPNQTKEEIIRLFNQAFKIQSEKDQLRSKARIERDELNKTTMPIQRYPICKSQILRMYTPRWALKMTDDELDLLLAISDKEFFTMDSIDLLYPASGITARKMMERKLIIPITEKSDILTTSRDAQTIIRNLYDCIFHNKTLYKAGDFKKAEE